MKIISILPVLIKSLRGAGFYSRTQFHKVALAVCCVLLGSASADLLADDEQNNSFQVKEEETQLAKRFALREAAEPPFEYSLSAGYRKDNMNWSIADGSVNVASEVNWKNTVIAQMRAAAKVCLWNDWLLRGVFTTGAVKSGNNQDSDYAGSNRTQEFSRSNNKTGGAVRDISIALGHRFRLFDFSPGTALTVIPLAGVSIHQQSLTMYDGQQTVPANGALINLDNSYNAQWKSAWLGMDATLGLGEHFALRSTVEYHRADYSADANWNLRSDFQHPVSFSHVANGYGIVASAGVSYRFSRNFQMNASFEKQKWDTYQGYDQTNFSYGATNYYPLNPVNLESTALSLGAIYQF